MDKLEGIIYLKHTTRCPTQGTHGNTLFGEEPIVLFKRKYDYM